LPTAADAAIVYFDINPDKQLQVGESLTFGSINLSNATYLLGSGGFSFTVSNNGGFTNFSGVGIEFAALAGFYTYQLAPGALISGSLVWGNPTFNGYGAGDKDFVGLRMDLGDGNYNYGWAAFAPVFEEDGPVFTITSFAFQGTSNTPILAGQTSVIPEPSTMISLILGGSAFAFSRRRKVAGAKVAS
jgi:hypothetical protein